MSEIVRMSLLVGGLSVLVGVTSVAAAPETEKLTIFTYDRHAQGNVVGQAA